jgi:simple sugar transport system ATP-binding protein
MSPAPVVAMEDITKAFGNVVANKDVTIEMELGRVHAVVGENGAGKSTLMQILCGMLHPDSGTIYLRGQQTRLNSTGDAIAAGIGMVYQHFKLIPSMTALENIVLGSEPQSRRFLIDEDAAAREVLSICERHGLEVPLNVPIRDASVGVRQKVEILRVLRREPDVVILDEPTAVLAPAEIEDLLVFLRRLTDHGSAVVLITHKLREVFAVADDVTVLRKGIVVARPDVRSLSPERLAEMMIGRELSEIKPRELRSRPGVALWQSSSLSVHDRSGVKKLSDVSLTLCQGEIVGVAGVDGNGQRELVDVITGAQTEFEGEVQWRGKTLARNSVSDAIARGVAYIPEDRQESGLIPPWPLAENTVLRRYRSRQFSNPWRLKRSKIRAHAESVLASFGVNSAIDAVASSLSGGNQQRLVVGRELNSNPPLVVAEQPTRGVDIGAIQFIYEQLIRMRDAGSCVLVISFDLDELLTLSDRLIVLYDGQMVADLPRSEANSVLLGELMTGARQDHN